MGTMPHMRRGKLMEYWVTYIILIFFVAWDFTFTVRAIAQKVYPAVFFFTGMLLIQIGLFAAVLVQTIPLIMKGR